MSDKTALEIFDAAELDLEQAMVVFEMSYEQADTIRQALEEKPCDVGLDVLKHELSKSLPHMQNVNPSVLSGFFYGWNALQGHITDKAVVNEKLTTEKPETITCTCGVIFTSKTKMINLDAMVDKLEEVLRK